MTERSRASPVIRRRCLEASARRAHDERPGIPDSAARLIGRSVREPGHRALSGLQAALFVTDLTYSSGIEAATLDLFNVADGKYVQTIPAGDSIPSTLVADASGKYLFAASQSHNLVSQARVYSTGDLAPPEHLPKPKSFLNVSTRLTTKPGDDALIGGFIIT